MTPADELRAAATRLEDLAEPVAYTAPWSARNECPGIARAVNGGAPDA